MSKSIYEKLALARNQFHGQKLEKSGRNTFAKYSYFELGDFIVPGMQAMSENGLTPVVSFGADYAQMTIHDWQGSTPIVITSPMSKANLKGCHDVQNVGAVETYQRRYLWQAALEIVEHDALSSNAADSPADLASEKAIAKINDLLTRTMTDAAKVCAAYKVESLDALTATQAAAAIKRLEAK